MAGKARKKLDYAGWSADMFENDTKIDKLLDSQGWIGFSIYFYLCQKAFGSDGYFYKWGFDDCASTARKMGGGVGSGTVKETVDYCFQIGLFDKRLFDRWGVLTSKGIQRSYWAVAKSRRDKTVFRELWLLDNNESEGVVFVSKNNDMSETNGYSSETNRENSHTNDTVVKESIVKESNNTVSIDTVRRTEVQRCVDAWNALSDCGIRPVMKMTNNSNRYKWLNARLDEYGIDDVLKAIENVRKSSFLCGGSKRGWMIDFEWFVRPNNFPKVMEGKYTDREANRSETGDHGGSNGVWDGGWQ